MTRRILTVILAWLPAAAICVLIFLLSQDAHSGRHSAEVLGWLLSLFGDNTRHFHHLLDGPFRKFAHVLVYFLLGAAAYRGFALGRRSYDLAAAARSVIFCALYALSDEYHQSFIPGRGPELSDVALDTAAAVVALLVLWLWLRPRRRSGQPVPGTVHSQSD